MTRRRIAITGASGHIGTKLTAFLRAGDWELLLLDRDARGNPDIVQVDLARDDPRWVALIAGVDTIVHLAADPMPDAAWDSLEPNNVNATLNLLHAAQAQGVARVILASSIQAAIGKVGQQARIGEQAPGAPMNLYGASKCVGERLGRHYARQFGLSVIALRIGWVQTGANRSGPQMGPIEHQQQWLSNRDLCRGIDSAIRATGIAFGVFNLLSDNQDMPWDLSEAARVLGWRPLDHSVPSAPPEPQAPTPKPPPRTLRSRLRHKLCKALCR